MLSISTQFAAYAPAAQPLVQARASVVMESKASLEALAKELNPSIGYWDPIGLANLGGNDGSPASGEAVGADSIGQERFIGYLRHSEIKHGRIAMAGFVGYCLQSNGVHFPWALQGGVFGGQEITFGDIAAAGGPADQWDALPTLAKLQIFGAIAFLEWCGENSKLLALSGEKHYMSGGTPGFYPSLKAGGFPHPVPLDLWDPFGFTKKMSPERKAKALRAEINNGRLAMIGLMGLISASKGLIVPGIDGLGVTPYTGEVMAPFSSTNADLPFVADMLEKVGSYGY